MLHVPSGGAIGYIRDTGNNGTGKALFYERSEVFCGEPTFCMASHCLNAISTARISMLAVIGMLLDRSARPCESATTCQTNGIFRENVS